MRKNANYKQRDASSLLLPISIYQKRFFLECLLEPNSSSYNISLAFKIKGAIESATLKKSIEHYVMENDVMHDRYSLDRENRYHGNCTIKNFYKELDLSSEVSLESQSPLDIEGASASTIDISSCTDSLYEVDLLYDELREGETTLVNSLPSNYEYI